METMNFEDQIINYDLIKDKMVSELTFKDIISLVFHAFKNLSNESINLAAITNHIVSTAQEEVSTKSIGFEDYYYDFLVDYQLQNQMGWPKLLINKNDHRRRLDACCLEPYVSSQNFLMLLLRMLSIENYKRTYIQKSYDYYKILGHKLDQNGATNKLPVTKLSFSQLFILVESCIRYYIGIYHDSLNIEHQIGLTLLRYME